MFNLKKINELKDFTQGNYRAGFFAQDLKERFPGYEILGEGVYKFAFSIPGHDDKILKIIKKSSSKDLEWDIEYYNCAPKFFPIVYDYDKINTNPNWVIVEKIDILRIGSGAKFVDLQFQYFEIDFEEYYRLLETLPDLLKFFADKSYGHLERIFYILDNWNMLINKYEPEKVRNLLKFFLSHKKFKEFILAMKKCGISVNDLHEGNYGFRSSDEQFIIIDHPIKKDLEFQIESLIRKTKTINESSSSSLFNTELFDNIAYLIYNPKNIEKILQNNNMKLIGQGSYKSVYSISEHPDKVLKVVQKERTYQIRDEIKNYECSSKYFPIVYAYDQKEYRWSIVEKIPITEETLDSEAKMEKLAFDYFNINKIKLIELNQKDKYFKDYQFNSIFHIFQLLIDFHDFKTYYSMQYKSTLEIFKYLFSLPKLRDFLKVTESCLSGLGDMSSANYGFRENGQFVIIDSSSGKPLHLELEGIIYNESI